MARATNPRNAFGSPVRPLLVVAAVGLLAFVAAACQPVASLGYGSLYNPVGVLDSVTAGPATVRVGGWAAEWTSGTADPWRIGTHGPTKIMVMVNGEWVAQAFAADVPRPDVDQAFIDNPMRGAFGQAVGDLQGYRRPGSPYGFDVTVPAPPGEVTVCVVAVNTLYRMATPENWNTGGDHVLLGCRTVTVT